MLDLPRRGADDMGKPIVRDCACRGNDAGFAHLSCITKYAQQKSELAVEQEEIDDFVTAWETCPNCKQDYQNDISLHLAEALVSFAERTYDHPTNSLWDKMNVMEALRLEIKSIRRCEGRVKAGIRHKFENLVHKMLEVVERAKKDHGINAWVRMDPTTDEFRVYDAICSNFEAYGYICLAQLCLFESNDSKHIDIRYYEKARDVYMLMGKKREAQQITDLIERARVKSMGDEAGHLENTKIFYEDSLKFNGESAETTILTGLSYVRCLQHANRSIEAERLVTKLSAISRQVYGDEHRLAKESFELLNKCKMRFIHKSLGCNAFLPFRYHALRYENDYKDCVAMAPFTDQNLEEDEQRDEFRIASAAVIPAIGCPVICHGLMNASHLNGKLGEVRSVSFGKGGGRELRLGVYFEDKSLKSAGVKPGNLRVAFVLPSE